MSQRNRDGKRSARERLRERQEQDRARRKRNRTLAVLGVVVGVLAVAAGVGVLAASGGGDDDSGGPVTAPRGATGKDDLVIAAGSASARSTLAVYEDFRCPACKQFEDSFRTTVHQLQKKGRLRTEYHLVTLIDGNLGGSGSLKAANAAACAQDSGHFAAYHDVLFRNQPQESDDAFGDNDRLIELAGRVRGLDTADFRACVRDGRHDGWVRASHRAFSDAGYGSTPTVLLDGKNVYADRSDPLTPGKLKKRVNAAAKG
ncbi:thioredoxin domain-containing protein [Streptomyces sp. B1866]|uniref:DsbA family protein n=1 Tax=Streptomyces sp. B1866 TaxID=3075431 RepID=UPI00288E1754|nr:thioredoxin domain-containing protein [Streptomyces sp. B1866]MDT3399240.1 thioredoxin domain-containing protein [Streptomyces sp. B1866]